MTKENKRKTGAEYERLAGQYLEKAGYQIMEYNYRCHSGEIDLIARDGAYLVFCEVKYRGDFCKGHPLEAVDIRKQRTLAKCAMHYMMENGLDDVPCRFDVVGICGEQKELDGDSDGGMILVRDAFECP